MHKAWNRHHTNSLAIQGFEGPKIHLSLATRSRIPERTSTKERGQNRHEESQLAASLDKHTN